MPLYEYRCRCCGERFEKVVHWAADPKHIVCPACAADAPERLLSLPAAVRGRGASADSGGYCPPAAGT